jgi:hypothetical protein
LTKLMKMVMESFQWKNSVKLYLKLLAVLTKKKKQQKMRNQGYILDL